MGIPYRPLYRSLLEIGIHKGGISYGHPQVCENKVEDKSHEKGEGEGKKGDGQRRLYSPFLQHYQELSNTRDEKGEGNRSNYQWYTC